MNGPGFAGAFLFGADGLKPPTQGISVVHFHQKLIQKNPHNLKSIPIRSITSPLIFRAIGQLGIELDDAVLKKLLDSFRFYG
jgi:hypothetical protein